MEEAISLSQAPEARRVEVTLTCLIVYPHIIEFLSGESRWAMAFLAPLCMEYPATSLDLLVIKSIPESVPGRRRLEGLEERSHLLSHGLGIPRMDHGVSKGLRDLGFQAGQQASPGKRGCFTHPKQAQDAFWSPKVFIPQVVIEHSRRVSIGVTAVATEPSTQGQGCIVEKSFPFIDLGWRRLRTE
jgi:hypothetical protein